jgi:hypothetical protein
MSLHYRPSIPTTGTHTHQLSLRKFWTRTKNMLSATIGPMQMLGPLHLRARPQSRLNNRRHHDDIKRGETKRSYDSQRSELEAAVIDTAMMISGRRILPYTLSTCTHCLSQQITISFGKATPAKTTTAISFRL